MNLTSRILAASIPCFCFIAAFNAQADALASLNAGGERLTATQNTDGGWGWPLTGASATNTVAPIGMGLAHAYEGTGSAAQLAALEKAGEFLLAKTNTFTVGDGYFAVELDSIFGGTAYSTYVKTNFYDKLEEGTYVTKSGYIRSTSTYLDALTTSRHGGGIGNLSVWDIGLGLYSAVKLNEFLGSSIDTSPWIAATKSEINLLVGGGAYDVLGLAGGVLGLSAAHENFDPTSGLCAASNSLSDLANQLAGYQLTDGSFTWNTTLLTSGNDSVQESAYALLALNEFDRANYMSRILNDSTYLMAAQKTNGGWGEYLGAAGEDNEVTGEALWAIRTASVPVPAAAWTGLVILGGLVARKGLKKHSAK